MNIRTHFRPSSQFLSKPAHWALALILAFCAGLAAFQAKAQTAASEIQATRQAPFASGLLARWTMDDASGTTLTDSSGNGVHGTITNAAWETGKFAGALNFNGTDSAVNIPHTFDPNQGSVTAWVKTSATANDLVVISEGLSTTIDSPYFMLTIHRGGAGIYHKRSGVGTVQAYGQTQVNDGRWHFIAWTHTGEANGLKVYVDGFLQTLTWESGSSDGGWFDDFNGDLYTLGALKRQAGHDYGFFNGSMDEISIYGRVLNADEIQAYYTAGSSVLARWDMNIGVGTAITDTTGSGYDGTAFNGAWEVGRLGHSLQFNGSNTYVALPHTFEMSQGSLAAWVKTTETSSVQVIFGEGQSSAIDAPYFMLTINVGKAGIYHKKLGQNDVRAYGNTVINDGEWHFIVWTHTGENDGLIIYVDGEPQSLTWVSGAADQAGWLNSYNGDTYSLGVLQRNPGSEFGFFNGSIDEVTLYDRALTQAEISAYYQKTAHLVYLPLIRK